MIVNREIFKQAEYRILEVLDFDTKIEGNPESVEVYGYVLEKWNGEIDKGWEDVDSCFGFVGEYDEHSNNHSIVEEFKQLINRGI